jgi:diacylglycerol kinase (ATP)
VRLKTHFIVNPRSGKAATALEAVKSFARDRGATLTITERSGHAGELARRALAENCELIVAVGGDGTMNEIASILVNSHAIFGLIPCGSGDGLGRHLGIHGSIDRALTLLVDGKPRNIDTGLANGRPFFAVAGLGFEAEIATRFNRLTKRGFWRYLATSARAWRQFVPISCSVVHGRERESLRAFTVAVANTDQYGNGARIAPNALVDDGLLDLTAVPPVSIITALPLVVRLFSGRLFPPSVWRRRAANFVVEDLPPGLTLHTDGETQPAGSQVNFSIQPASLRVMAPPRL